MEIAAYFAAIAVTALGNISERRIAQLVSDFKILPPFLARDPGVESGFMIAHVTAAALCNENKVLSHPASADSISTSANKEDFVSMGMTAALKLKEVVRNTARVTAIEMMAAAEGIEFHRPLKSSRPLEKALARLREVSPAFKGDEVFSGRIEAVAEAVLAGHFTE
ncbi:MAG TPA: aromatic amino acid lyase [Elusimicrobiales bacterium]|nr:aromatic amino acid lyase [Elusimicrobiales bacterium]